MTLARRILWVMTIAYWVLAFTLTHTPPKNTPDLPGSDKTKHFLGYLVLAFLIGTTWYLAFPRRRRLMPLMVVVIAAAYGAFDEVTQAYVGRTPDLHDWYADMLGALAAAALLFVLERLLPPRAAEPPAAS
jgi:VanZ family protein